MLREALVIIFCTRQFVADTLIALVVLTTIAFLIITQFTTHLYSLSDKATVDWRLVPLSVLILFALWILAGLAVACATRFDLIPTLAICSVLFFLGLISDYLFGKSAENGSWFASILYSLLPNWQNFWMVDTLEPEKSGVPMIYLAKSFIYTLGLSWSRFVGGFNHV